MKGIELKMKGTKLETKKAELKRNTVVKRFSYGFDTVLKRFSYGFETVFNPFHFVLKLSHFQLIDLGINFSSIFYQFFQVFPMTKNKLRKNW